MSLVRQGRGLGGRRRRPRSGATVDLTPLIDVTFQLLIFFLLTATFRDFSSLDVELAEAKNKNRPNEQKAVVVSIDEAGQVEIDNKVVDIGELEMRLCAAFEEGKTTVHIRADQDSRHLKLVDTMDLARRCGFQNLGILHGN